MINKKDTIKLLEISSKIIEILNDRDKMDSGDFQGCLEAQVMTAYLLGAQKNSMSQSSINLINELLDGEYNTTEDEDDYRYEIQETQRELDLITIKK